MRINADWLIAAFLAGLIGSIPMTHGAPPALPEGTAMLKGGIDDFQFSATPPENAARAAVQVKDQPFASAVRVRILKQPAEVPDIFILAPTTMAVQKGEALLASVWLRGEPGADAIETKAGVVFRLTDAPDARWLRMDLPLSRQWQRFDIPFLAKQKLEAGKGQFGFFLGYAPESVEIGPVSLTDFGAGVSLADLPATRFSYVGREADAPWRKAALERIEKIRKGDLTVTVLDAAGRAVPGAQVNVKMTRHAFAFGSAVAAGDILGHNADADIYRQHVLQMFNCVVVENALKWPGWNERRGQALAAVKWLGDHGIEVRGHNLVWPHWEDLPANAVALKNDPQALRQAIADHITDEATALRGKVCQWDVVNEPDSAQDVLGIPGKGVMADWFKLARAADPKVLLFVNDYAMPDGAAGAGGRWNSYAKTIRTLLDDGASLDGIGIQCHFGAIPPPPRQLIDGFDRFAEFHKLLEVTEFDFDTQDEALQADYTHDFLIACFSSPQVDGILMWGFWEGRHWIPDAALFRKDWSIKPNGKAWMDLVLKQWWTDESGKTDSAGQYKVRGFLGSYQVTATVGGTIKSASVVLGSDGASPTIKFK